ncbi:hypothetical protein [Microbacterium sp. 179-I 3D3 NHS]|uniref:hypothetical protein n=1 Tax=Microbacterium sp. 179-I 3D3 NHS TaxID=3142382 RepID=UPI0039A3C045
MRRRGWIAVGAVALLLLVGAGATLAWSGAEAPAPAGDGSAVAEAGPRPLTADEAERLAVARFLAYRDGSRTFETAVPTADGTVTLRGRFDHRGGVGIATAVLDGESAVITWDDALFVGWTGAGSGEEVPTAPPASPGAARPLDPTESSIDAVLVLLLNLGADRPDNAQLLETSDARWLRGDDVDGTAVDVFSGPTDAASGAAGGTTRFWIDESGALRRFEADLPAGAVSIDLNPEEHVAVPRAPELG